LERGPMKAANGTILAIDVHGHYGTYRVDTKSELANGFQSGDAETVVRRARAANTEITIVSPLSGLLPRGRADAVAGNEEAARVVAQTAGLLQWVIVHPLQPATFDQARRRLADPHCVGIKIHPEEHQYPITEYGPALFRFAAELGAVVLAHSGDPYSLPAGFVPLADAFPDVRLILAHLGNGGQAAGEPDLQVRAIQAAKHGNLWTDTSSARSILPGLIEWAVAEVGPERILYGTDTPIYFAPNQRARIDHAEISDAAKRLILRDNALRLLDLSTNDQ
jgi:predicted TIM-barrel fold metal-dependent hydrolase